MEFKRVLFIAFLLHTAQAQHTTGIKRRMDNDLTYLKTRMQSLTTDAIFFAQKFETEQRERRETEQRIVQIVHNLTEQNIKLESKLNNAANESAQLNEEFNLKTSLLEDQLGVMQGKNLKLETEFKSANSTIFRLENQLKTLRADYVSLAGQVSGISSDNVRVDKKLTAGNVGLDEDLKLSTSVSFSAYVFPDLKNVAVSAAIPFRSLRNNEGSHYNPSTGVFTAPVGGTYFFYSALLLKEYGTAGIVVNGSNKLNLVINGKPGEFQMAGNSLIVHLSEGSNVHVAFNIGRNPPSLVYKWRSTFSGFLIKAD